MCCVSVRVYVFRAGMVSIQPARVPLQYGDSLAPRKPSLRSVGTPWLCRLECRQVAGMESGTTEERSTRGPEDPSMGWRWDCVLKETYLCG